MRTPIEDMTREQLIAELPKRMLAMSAFLALVCVWFTVLAFVAMQSSTPIMWVAAFVVNLLLTPFVLARVARWMVMPAHVRIQRRKRSMYRALAEFSFTGGDSRV